MPKGIRLAPDVRTRLVDLYQQGMTLSEASRACGLTASACRTALQKAGVTCRNSLTGKVNRLTAEESLAIVARYREGASLEQIERETGRVPQTLRKVLRRAGVAIRSGGSYCICLSSAQTALAVKMYEDEHSAYEIADAFGVSRGAVTNALRRVGCFVRSGGRYWCDVSNAGAFDNPLSPEAKYWAGFLMADGCVSLRRDGNFVTTLSLASCDAAHVRTFASFVGSSHKIQERLAYGLGNAQPQTAIAVGSNHLAESLIALGVTPRKTFTAKAVPYLANDPDYWRGEVDGDGTVGAYPNNSGPLLPRINLTGSTQTAEQFAAYALRIAPWWTGTIIPLAISKGIAVVSITGRAAVEVIRSLYYPGCPVALPRKWEIAQKIIRDYDAKPTRVLVRHNTGWLTPEILLRLFGEAGNWRAVAKQIGLNEDALRSRLRRLRRLNLLSPGQPPPLAPSRISADAQAIDRACCAEAVCGACGSLGLTYHPQSLGQRYRALAVCSCGAQEEF